MKCPRCNTNLALSITQGIEIDYCPDCRGVWLDSGELEKILERSGSFNSSNRNDDEHSDHNEDNHGRHNERQGGYGQQSRHRKGFLSELFDF